MTREEETLFIRQLQEADVSGLRRHLTLRRREKTKAGNIRLTFDAVCEPDEGYLIIEAKPDSRELLAAEMNVGFPTLIGLNRSPLELRILSEHVLDLLFEDEALE